MQLFPAIDLRGGRVVRLTQGDYDRMTVYGQDPCAQARTFSSADIVMTIPVFSTLPLHIISAFDNSSPTALP